VQYLDGAAQAQPYASSERSLAELDKPNQSHVWKRSGAGFNSTSSLEIIMFRKLALAVALAAIALPAAAHTEVKVSLAGLDAKAAHAVILQAAQAACRAELADQSSLVQFYARPDCIDAAVAKAETSYSSMRGLAAR
jgi:hypothetical protein